MKIGINASFLRKPDTGIGQVTANFIKQLKNSNISQKKDVSFYLYLEEESKLKLPKNFHKVVSKPKFWRRDDLFRKTWWEMFSLPRRAANDGCDIFISLYQCPTIFSRKNLRHKMLVHDLIPKVFPEYLDNWRKKIHFFLTRRAIRKADKIFTISEWSKRDIQKYLKISEKKIKVAYPSVGSEFFETPDHEKNNEVLEKYGVYGRYVFYVGGFDFRKNMPELLEAFKVFSSDQENSGIKLVLGGEDKSKFSALFTDVKQEIEKRGLGEDVQITGFIEQKDLPAFYRNCELFVFPTLYEGFGLPPLEALACGAPLAVSHSSSLPEVCGRAALYFNPYDPEEMARVMGRIIHSLKLKRQLSEKGKERAQKFNWQNFTEIILNS